MMLNNLRNDIKNLSNPEKAQFFKRFFKTGKGEYGEGDLFLGITVPEQRKVAVKYKDLPLHDITTLLQSQYHEERLIALLILVLKYKKGNEGVRGEIYQYYLAHTKYINNWDLVDSSADKIVGEYLLANSERRMAYGTLKQLAVSKNIWERRIAMIATYAFIKNGEAALTLQVADVLIADRHDLIQKAVGWMLREVGKRVSQEIEEEFLKTRYKTMPRTALRYAIEHFSPEKRLKYLHGAL